MSAKRLRLISVNCDRPFVRAVLLAAVFAAVVWAFSWNFERRMVQLNAGYIQDSGQVLGGAERRRLEELRGLLQQQVGLKLLIRVELGQGPVQLPSNAADTLFMGVNPQTGAALIVLPPLAKKVMGEGQRLLLEEDLSRCVAESKMQGAESSFVFVCLERGAQAVVQALTDAK